MNTGWAAKTNAAIPPALSRRSARRTHAMDNNDAAEQERSDCWDATAGHGVPNRRDGEARGREGQAQPATRRRPAPERLHASSLGTQAGPGRAVPLKCPGFALRRRGNGGSAATLP